MTLVLTSSRVGSYLACPYRHWLGYELGIRRELDGVRASVGTGFHAGLEQLSLGKSLDEATAAARTPVDELDRDKAACMVAGWHWRWSESPMFKKILATEQVFEFKPVKRSRWSWAGKIDVIGELEDGRVAVGEYKTVSEDIAPASDYWRRLLIDRQISGYVLGGRAAGFPVDTVIYDATRMPGIKLRQIPLVDENDVKIVLDATGQRVRTKDGKKWRESGDSSLGYIPQTRIETAEEYATRLMEDIGRFPEWYFGRQEIPRLPADIDAMTEDMTHFADMIRSSRRGNRWPRNTDACQHRKFGKCPYFDPCTNSHDPLTQGLPSGFKRVQDIHVELTIERDNDDAGNDEQHTSTT